MLQLRNLWSWITKHAYVASALLALLIYLRTLAPDVYVSDFAEFQYQPYLLGLPHPNGFPLYMLLGWAWSHLPWGHIAWRMNLLSAFSGAVAVCITAHFVYRVSGSRSVASLAGILLAFSRTFWGYSLCAERYSLNLALLAASLWCAWEVGARASKRMQWAVGSAFLLGLGLATHPSDALLVPFWLGLLAWRLGSERRSARLWTKVAFFLCVPLVLYAYVPWRWAVFARWPGVPGINRSLAVYQGLVHVWYEPPLRWDLILYYITGLGGYATGLLRGGWYDALMRMDTLWPVWRAEIPWWVAIAALAGWPRVWRRSKDVALALPAFAAFLTVMVAYIQQGKNEAYLLPAFWVVYFMAPFALEWFAFRGGVALRAAAPVVALLALTIPQYGNLDLSRRVDIREWWEAVLQLPVEEGAAFLGHWSDFTPLWYLQHIEGKRPDLVALFPPDVERVIQPWLDTGKPLYLAAPTHGWAPDLAQRFQLVPWGRLVRILPPGTPFSCFRHMGRSPAYRVGPLELSKPWWRFDAPLKPTQPASLLFCWRTQKRVDKAVFVAVQLEPADQGRALEFHAPLLVGWDPRESVGPDTEGLAQVVVTPPLGTAPGEYTVTLSFFKLGQDGSAIPWEDATKLTLGRVVVEPTTVFTRHHVDNATVPLVSPRAGTLSLRAWHLSDKPVRPGDPVVLRTWWEVESPPQDVVALQIRFWNGVGRPRESQPQPLSLPGPFHGQRVVLRAEHVFRAPKGIGDSLYFAELRLTRGDRALRWWPWPAILVGTVLVKDRPHLWGVPPEAVPVHAAWPSVAALEGYTLDPPELAPGKTLTVTLYWRSLGFIDRSYKVFVHLVGPDGHIVTQHDAFPAQNTLPTDIWVPQEVIPDRHPLFVPEDLPAGTYTLLVGLYHPETGERLDVNATSGVTNRALILHTFELPSRP